MSKHPKSEMVSARVTPEAKIKLVELAAQMDLGASDIVRELVMGFIEGRVTLAPPQKEGLYNVTRTED